jgi:hypothetical protein
LEELVNGFLVKAAQVVGVIVAGVLLMLAAFAAITSFGKDPMNSHGRGPGWECDRTSGGAVTCDKDAPIPAKPK